MSVCGLTLFKQISASLACSLLCLGVALAAQASDGKPPSIDEFFSLPIELDADFGATNGDATFLKIAPLYNILLNDKWSLVNLDLIVLADAPGGVPGSPGNPSPEMGDKTFGLADLTHISVFTPTSTGNFTYGIGFLATLPIATDGALGSDKWSLGPAFRLIYRYGPWTLGVTGGNQWSYSGDNDRADINQMILRGAFRRELANRWYLVSAPVITGNWKAKSGEELLLPLGGGIGKIVDIGSRSWAVSIQGFANVVKPNGAPDWSARFTIVAPIPVGMLSR